jgi:hypothetical protein
VNDTPSTRSRSEDSVGGPTDGPTVPESNVRALVTETLETVLQMELPAAEARRQAEVLVAALLATRDRYEAALREISNGGFYYGDDVPWPQRVAREALAAAQEGTNG